MTDKQKNIILISVTALLFLGGGIALLALSVNGVISSVDLQPVVAIYGAVIMLCAADVCVCAFAKRTAKLSPSVERRANTCFKAIIIGSLIALAVGGGAIGIYYASNVAALITVTVALIGLVVLTSVITLMLTNANTKAVMERDREETSRFIEDAINKRYEELAALKAQKAADKKSDKNKSSDKKN